MGDVWERKMRAFYRRLDFDNDGVVSRADFSSMAQRFADLEKFNPEQKETIRKCFNDVFSIYTKAAGSDVDVLLTEDLLIKSIKLQKDDPALGKAIGDMYVSAFKPMDVNQDGFLDFEEYRRAFENVGIGDSESTKAAFEAIDINHDGKLSFEEIIKAANDYMCSDNEKSAAMFGLPV